MNTGTSISVPIEWSGPFGCDVWNQLPAEQGVYIWIYPESVVNYVGETHDQDFKVRTSQHLANVLGYGGTFWKLEDTDEARKWMRDPGAAADAGKVFGASGHGEQLDRFADEGKRRDWITGAMDYLTSVKILCGSIRDRAINTGEIEGGIIDALRTTYDLAPWPGSASNNTVIGQIAPYPTQSYKLTYHGSAEATDTAHALLDKALPNGLIVP